MDAYICESFAASEGRVVCNYCNRSIKYYDKLSNGIVTCLSCSYENKFVPSEECLYHPRVFDPGDQELRLEMIKIAEIDIKRSTDKDKITIVIPKDLKRDLQKILDKFRTKLNPEIVAGLGWYVNMYLREKEEAQGLINLGLDSVKADVPAELSVLPDGLDL